ncbi:MAG: hypothetical protein J6B34_04005 [Clostridia bacterium]|nr:hypothetical protein [Clostridia bacterium]
MIAVIKKENRTTYLTHVYAHTGKDNKMKLLALNETGDGLEWVSVWDKGFRRAYPLFATSTLEYVKDMLFAENWVLEHKELLPTLFSKKKLPLKPEYLIGEPVTALPKLWHIENDGDIQALLITVGGLNDLTVDNIKRDGGKIAIRISTPMQMAFRLIFEDVERCGDIDWLEQIIEAEITIRNGKLDFAVIEGISKDLEGVGEDDCFVIAKKLSYELII